MVTCDEPKRLLNITAHQMDFVGCEVVFDGPITAKEMTGCATVTSASTCWAGWAVTSSA